tara:strand:- start:6091 stop:6519 length:429 start_codon:yes stop_codon:yes gene_type:complete
MKNKVIFLSLVFISVIILNNMDYLNSPNADRLSKIKVISVIELNNINQEKNNDNILLDVRTEEEFNLGHIPNAINISHDLLLNNLSPLNEYKEKNIYVYCRSGVRASLIINELLSNEFNNIIDVEGDFLSWVNAKLPIEIPK